MANNSSVTVRELATELKRFADGLSETATQLRTELAGMGQAQSQINQELSHTAKSFVEKNLTALEGHDFDTMAEIAQNVEELSSQGLAFFRSSLVTQRDRALQTVNESLDKTVDAEGFKATLQEATEAYRAAKGAADEEKSKLDAAKTDLKTWQDNTVENNLVDLDDEIAKKGGLRLTSDNRGYYEVPNIFVAVWRYITNATYRNVRHTLEKYGHGKDGKDAFADIVNFRKKYEEYNQAISAAQTPYDAALAKQNTAQTVKNRLAGLAGDIKTDAQILSAVQDKVTADLKESPEFMQALAAHYAEDFPRNLPFLFAKLATLDTLQKGTKSKLEDVQLNYEKITDQYRKLSRLQSSLRVKNINLESLRKQNDAYRAECNHYSKAARQAWNRARDYSYDDYFRQRGSTVPKDNSPDLIKTILMYQMLTSGNRDRFDRPPSTSELAKDSRFAADLMGVDKDTARKAGLPDSVFDISDDTAREMAALGVADYRQKERLSATFDIGSKSAGARSRRDGIAFDIETPPPPPPLPTRSSSSSIGGGSNSFKIGSSSSFGSRSRPSGGGGSSFKIGSSSSRSSSFTRSSSPRGGGGRSFKI